MHATLTHRTDVPFHYITDRQESQDIRSHLKKQAKTSVFTATSLSTEQWRRDRE